MMFWAATFWEGLKFMTKPSLHDNTYHQSLAHHRTRGKPGKVGDDQPSDLRD